MTDEMFTLAHLSDPHLAPMPVPNFARLRVQAVRRLRELAAQPPVHSSDRGAGEDHRRLLAQKPDHIAMTGDIANIALPFEFARGRDWLERTGDGRRT